MSEPMPAYVMVDDDDGRTIDFRVVPEEGNEGHRAVRVYVRCGQGKHIDFLIEDDDNGVSELTGAFTWLAENQDEAES